MLRLGPLPSLRLTASHTMSRFTLNANSTSYFGNQTEAFDLLGLRYLAYDGTSFRIAPYLMTSIHRGGSKHNFRIANRFGLALEKDIGKWRTDASLGLAGYKFFPGVRDQNIKMSTLDSLLGSELGLSRQIGSSTWFRLGLMGPLPTASVATRLKNIIVKGSAGTLGDQHFFHIDVFPFKSAAPVGR